MDPTSPINVVSSILELVLNQSIDSVNQCVLVSVYIVTLIIVVWSYDCFV